MLFINDPTLVLEGIDLKVIETFVREDVTKVKFKKGVI